MFPIVLVFQLACHFYLLMQKDIADSLRESLVYFNQYYRYPLERLVADYQQEIKNYRDNTWEAPQRAARLNDAVKNYKTSRMIEFVFYVANKSGIDLTPLVVKTPLYGSFSAKIWHGEGIRKAPVFGAPRPITEQERNI